MEAEKFRDLLRSFLEGTIDRKSYASLFSYLAGILRKKGAGNLEHDEVGDIVRDFMVKLLENRHRFASLMDDPQGLRSYVGKALKNLYIDYLRKNRKRELLETELKGDNERESSIERNTRDLIQACELVELESLFRKEVRPENVKYFCYLLDSKRYRCLWGDRSADAVYQDVFRKKHTVEEFGRKLKELNVSDELVREFIKKVLSAICEELRSKVCKEEHG